MVWYNTSTVTTGAGQRLSSTSLATNSSGAEETGSRTLYYPYGEERWSASGGTLPTDYGFTGQRREGFGLMDYNARFYDPYLGRFISPNTIVPDPANPQSFNRYSYVYNNPLKYTDSSGHCPVCMVVILGGLMVGVLAARSTLENAPERAAILNGYPISFSPSRGSIEPLGPPAPAPDLPPVADRMAQTLGLGVGESRELIPVDGSGDFWVARISLKFKVEATYGGEDQFLTAFPSPEQVNAGPMKVTPGGIEARWRSSVTEFASQNYQGKSQSELSVGYTSSSVTSFYGMNAVNGWQGEGQAFSLKTQAGIKYEIRPMRIAAAIVVLATSYFMPEIRVPERVLETQ